MPESDDIAVDEVLAGRVDLARDALLEITPAETIGEFIGHTAEADHVVSLRFACTLLGYPGWQWTVTLARVSDDAEPTVLEAELMPGDDALLAPDWVPWSERLAEYQASQEATEDDTDDDTDADDLDAADEGDDDLDDDELDGVDIDALHDSVDDADQAEESDDTDDDAGDTDDDDTDDDVDYEADDITGAELAALDLEVDESDAAEDGPDTARRDPQRRGRRRKYRQRNDHADQGE